MKITERQGKILNSIVTDYIGLAQPISSEFLENKHDFGICPASIRIEMQKLTDKGFLSQPHTSAGRMPTDRGYRFFVDSLLDKGISDFEDVFEIEKMFKEEKEDILRFASHLSKFLAETSSNLATIHLPEKDFFFKEGWEEIFEEPEFKEQNLIFGFTRLLENFEKNIENLKVNSKSELPFMEKKGKKRTLSSSPIKVYIGKENPFSKSKDFSIISSKCILPDEEQVIISLLGPKRMDYDRNISLINSLIQILEKL